MHDINDDSRLYRELFKISYEIRFHDPWEQLVRAINRQSSFCQSWAQSYHANAGLLVMIRILFDNFATQLMYDQSSIV